MRILIIEDEDNSRLAIEAFLSSLGYRVEGVSSVDEALNLVQEEEFVPDLMICDWMLRGGDDGVKLATRIAVQHPGVEIVFVTGQAPEELRRAASHLRVREFMAKPFSLGELWEVVVRTEEKADRAKV